MWKGRSRDGRSFKPYGLNDRLTMAALTDEIWPRGVDGRFILGIFLNF